MRLLKFLNKWARNFLPQTFPTDFSSLEEIIQWGKQNEIDAFNGQFIRAFILFKISEYFDCSSFVETGTYHGYTAGFVARVFNTVVFSCEVNRLNYWISKLFLLGYRNVKVSHQDSPIFLRSTCGSYLAGDNPMFYLDAHWYPHVPLNEELEIIFGVMKRAVIVIDDFAVEGDERFGYDEYGSIKLNYDFIKPSIEKYVRSGNARVYYPHYNPNDEIGGRKRGMVVIFYNQNILLPETFPFNLLGQK